jgi:hypothetical protein
MQSTNQRVGSAIVLAALVALVFATGSGALEASVYIQLTSSFLVTASGILTTLAVYLGGISVLYLVLAKQKWWKLLRLDALIGAAVLLIIDIACFATNLSNMRKRDGDVRLLAYLIVIVDASLCLLAAGVVGVAIYAAHKLKTRTYLAVGNVREPAHVQHDPQLTDGCRCRPCWSRHPSCGSPAALLS